MRPIDCMMGPHHLNEVFFDDVWVTEADVLGTVDGGWSVVQEVLSFERVGVARYARCERLLHGHRQRSATSGSAARRTERPLGADAHPLPGGPGCSPTGWWRCRTRGRVRPGDAAAYRIAVTKLDQDSAEVLMEIVGPTLTGADGTRFRREVEDHWRYSQASTVASGSIEMQRILLARAMMAHREPGPQRRGAGVRPPGPTGVRGGRGRRARPARRDRPDCREACWRRCSTSSGRGSSTPRATPKELEAAAALCRSAGYRAIPYPVAERLAAPPPWTSTGSWSWTGRAPARWPGSTCGGRRWASTGASAWLPPDAPQRERRRSAFVCSFDLEPIGEEGPSAGPTDVALSLVLPCWTLLGMLDRALDLTRSHILDRRQFGQPLASFQGVQFQMTDAEVERVGLEELAKYALWAIEAGREEALDDALALRLAAIYAAEIVFRVAHQLHGAIGFCDETALSWLSRYSAPLRRLPTGRSATTHLLAGRLGRTWADRGSFDEPWRP